MSRSVGSAHEMVARRSSADPRCRKFVRLYRTSIGRPRVLFDTVYVEWMRTGFGRHRKNIAGGHVQELGAWIDETADKPGHAIRSIFGRARVTHLSVGSFNSRRVGRHRFCQPAMPSARRTASITGISQRVCRARTNVAAIGAINDDWPIGRQTVEPVACVRRHDGWRRRSAGRRSRNDPSGKRPPAWAQTPYRGVCKGRLRKLSGCFRPCATTSDESGASQNLDEGSRLTGSLRFPGLQCYVGLFGSARPAI